MNSTEDPAKTPVPRAADSEEDPSEAAQKEEDNGSEDFEAKFAEEMMRETDPNKRHILQLKHKQQ